MATKHFIAMVQTQYKSQIKGWMSNAGGEYKSKAFDKLLLDNGIRVFQSAPHTPQQNGRAKQLMHTLNKKSESMRHDACLPDNWWEFSFAHAIHIYNQTPLHQHNWWTPYELLNKEVSDISHLRVLGCAAYVFLPKDVCTNKLAPKSELMVYIGVAPGNEQNYLFMHSPNNIIFTAPHALFDKLHFPKCAQRTSTGPESCDQSDHWPSPKDIVRLLPSSGNSDDNSDYLSQQKQLIPPPVHPPCTPSPHWAPSPLHGPQRPSQSTVPPRDRPQCEHHVPKQPDNVYGDD